jgi:hypothetical protein
MTTHNVFTKLANRMVGAMMIHTQLTELFDFIDLKLSEVSLSYTGWHDAEVKQFNGTT